MASHEHLEEAASDAVCPEGHEAVTCNEELPADEVQVLLRPAARIVDRVTGALTYAGRYCVVLLDREDRELCASKQHYSWDEAVALAGHFKGKDTTRAIERWRQQAP